MVFEAHESTPTVYAKSATKALGALEFGFAAKLTATSVGTSSNAINCEGYSRHTMFMTAVTAQTFDVFADVYDADAETLLHSFLVSGIAGVVLGAGGEDVIVWGGAFDPTHYAALYEKIRVVPRVSGTVITAQLVMLSGG